MFNGHWFEGLPINKQQCITVHLSLEEFKISHILKPLLTENLEMPVQTQVELLFNLFLSGLENSMENQNNHYKSHTKTQPKCQVGRSTYHQWRLDAKTKMSVPTLIIHLKWRFISLLKRHYPSIVQLQWQLFYYIVKLTFLCAQKIAPQMLPKIWHMKSPILNLMCLHFFTIARQMLAKKSFIMQYGKIFSTYCHILTASPLVRWEWMIIFGRPTLKVFFIFIFCHHFWNRFPENINWVWKCEI